MKLSARGANFIKGWEKCRLLAYLDGGGVWTIGWGHTGPDVKEGMRCSMGDAHAWFADDVAEAESAVNRLVQVPITQNQFDALVSLCFNIGVNAFAKSTLLKKLNGWDYQGAMREFPRWKYDNGVEVAGLLNRRLQEQGLFREVSAA
jgi:lysozyme